MSARPSMWSLAMKAHWLETACCPSCHETNRPIAKPLLELNEDGTALCNCCGKTFEAYRPRAVAVG
jgi:hypothetical protein